VVAFTQMCTVVPLDTKITLATADICSRHKLATADAIVYATALEHGADLLTCEAHFDGLPGVPFSLAAIRRAFLVARPFRM
jgi:predicted nucleic acid-binding protein